MRDTTYKHIVCLWGGEGMGGIFTKLSLEFFEKLFFLVLLNIRVKLSFFFAFVDSFFIKITVFFLTTRIFNNIY
jgi:hypothetical protein